MVENLTPIVPEGTPLPTPPVGVPPYPITPFAVWTWDSPVIPSFYWNVYSAEQRVKMICKEIGKIEAYLNYLVNTTNQNLIDLQSQIAKLDTRLTALEKKLAEEVARLDALIAKLREDLTAETKAREDADTALDSRITSESNKLHTEISDETQNRIHADDQLHGEITAETQARQDADTDLEARVRADLSTETQAREAGDSALGDRITSESEKLHGEVSAEAQARIHADDSLHGEISQEVQDRQAADTALKAALEKEISDGDSSLHTEISTETQARKDADTALETKLAGEISTEAKAREDADKSLGERITADVSKEVQDRTHADDALHTEISTETQARQDADSALEAKLTNEIAKRLLPTEVTAGDEISITQPDPNSNRIVIASTVAHSISGLETEVAGVKAALEAEVSERRAEDSKLWQAVNQRLERGKLLAGEGITVQNDPDKSTATVSAKVTEAALSAVEGKATTAQETAEAASTAATEAKNTATTASTKATEAKNAADSAATTAGEAKTAAQDAASKATGAESKAEEALTAAQGSLKKVAHAASLTGDGTASTPLALTPATATTLGGVKVGAGLAVTSDGTLSATAQGGTGSYTLPAATETTLGGVKIGVGLAVETDGTLSATEDTHAGEGEESTAVGDSSSATGSDSTALGNYSSAEKPSAVALGAMARATGNASVALGTNSVSTEAETVSFGTGDPVLRGPKTRRLVNVTDPVNAQDAATKSYVDTHSASTTVSGTAPVTVSGSATAGYTIGVATAAESTPGVITESRVKELAGENQGITTAVNSGLLGDGTESDPLRINPIGYGLEITNGSLKSTVPSIGVAVVRCNIDNFNLAKGETKIVSKKFRNKEGEVHANGLSSACNLIAAIPDTNANPNLNGAIVNVKVNGSSSGLGKFTIDNVTATFYAANELQNVSSFGVTLLFSDTISYATYQEIPKAS